MAEVANMCTRGIINPIENITTFNIRRLEEAMMFMGKGSHAGKVVITYSDEDTEIEVKHPVCFMPSILAREIVPGDIMSAIILTHI